MEFQFNPEILIELPNLEETLKLFKDIMNLPVTKYDFENSEMYEIKTGSVNFYLKSGETYKIIFDFLTKDREVAKKLLLENSCSIYRWDKVGYHIEHSSGFTFNVGEK